MIKIIYNDENHPTFFRDDDDYDDEDDDRIGEEKGCTVYALTRF